ncbi:MAG: hypothetical protein LBG96_16780 [Tannerella sp.]|jgi:hypothetical protein|nr:hypothetical protein [Tannerella sp.]
MIINSKFSSLYLGKWEEWQAPFDEDVCFLHTYAIGEEMRIQFIGFTDVFYASYSDRYGNETSLDVELLYTYDNSRYLFEIAFSVADPGLYELYIGSVTDQIYSYFCIKPLSELSDNTVLLNYAHRRNEYDTIFIGSDGFPRRFNFRVYGGIYPGDKEQAIDNEVFRDQRFESFQTAAESYEISVLTIGTPRGVPQWVGNRINNIFKLSDVLVNGVETTRNEGSVPELVKVGQYYPLYVFKLNIEQPDEERVYTASPDSISGMIITRDGNPIITRDGNYIVTRN